MSNESVDARNLADAIQSGSRRALARAITLVESTRADHRSQAEALVETLLPGTGGAIRLGISGAPGAGKSTFIEAFGSELIRRGHRVAVLAVDPTSRRTGGSILGDKTRMERLTRSPNAFIRPTPAGNTLGGVARHTREAVLLCEAAGFDVVIVETVGVGQSEYAVADMTDLFVLLVSPGSGDELQGIKRGIMELADLVVITKADGDLAIAAQHALGDHKRALQFLRPPHPEITPGVLAVSSPNGDGIETVADRIAENFNTLRESGALEAVRAHQRNAWFWSEMAESFRTWILTDKALSNEVTKWESEISAGTTTPLSVVARILAKIRPEK